MYIFYHKLRSELDGRGEVSLIFGHERDTLLADLLDKLDQTEFGQALYPTIENKAAHLLYFVVKNRPLLDGNSRFAAFLFVEFLNRNGALQKNGDLVLNAAGLAALVLLISRSVPSEKDLMIHLVEHMLAPGKP